MLLVLISGGIDVSFPAVGAFAMYTTMTLVLGMDVDMPIVGLFIVSAGIGAALGLGAAMYLSEYASRRVRKFLKPVVELLAATGGQEGGGWARSSGAWPRVSGGHSVTDGHAVGHDSGRGAGLRVGVHGCHG